MEASICILRMDRAADRRTAAVKLGDILWDEDRILVHSLNTQRYEDHARREIPIFSGMAELLDKAYREARQGVPHVLPFLQGRTGASLRKMMPRATVADALRRSRDCGTT